MFTFRTILMLLCLSCYTITSAQNNSDINLQANHNFSSSHNYIDIDDTTNQFDGIQSHKHSFSNVCGQAFLGTACALFLASPLLTLNLADLERKNQLNSRSVILSLIVYSFGTAFGVHWVAKSENLENSFWGTVGSSIIGAGIGSGLVSILPSDNNDLNSPGVILAALCPLISSIIYTCFIADWPSDSQNISFHRKDFLHKDLIEQSKLFDAQLFQFNF